MSAPLTQHAYFHRRTLQGALLLAPALWTAQALAETSDAPAYQENHGYTALEEVVVAARRREESAQEVPIALSVIDDAALRNTGAFTLDEVQRLVPSLQIFSYNPRNTNINIRGLGSNVAFTNDGLENGVGVYVDNVYYARPGQSQFDLIDLAQIDVLRGPQGTLFGKNTTAGAINISTRKPAFEQELTGEISFANYGQQQIRATASGPLIDDRLAYRLTIGHSERDGYIKNIFNGENLNDLNSNTVRAQLLALPSDTLEVRIIADYARQDSHCCVNSLVRLVDSYENGAPIPETYAIRAQRIGYDHPTPAPFERRVDIDGHVQADMENYGASAQLDWEQDTHTLTSITAYRFWDWNPGNDSDATSLPILTKTNVTNRQRQFSQELRLASSGDNEVDYVAGIYYLWQRNEGESLLEYGDAAASWYLSALPAVLASTAINGFRADATTDPESKTAALFSQWTWHASDALELTAGLRYTREEKRGSYARHHAAGASLAGFPAPLAAAVLAIRQNFASEADFSADLKDEDVSGLLSASYQLAPSTLIYASVAKASKSGGLNLTALPAGVPYEVAPESVISYELGAKSQWLDDRLTLNGALFWTEIDDYQSTLLESNLATGNYVQYISNVGSVRSRGIEADAAYRATDNLFFWLSATYTDATYLDYPNALQANERLNEGSAQDLSGEALAGAPELSGNAGVEVSHASAWSQTFNGEFYATANYAYQSAYFSEVSNSRLSEVDGYGLLSARLGVREQSGRWDVSLWAKNLTDEHYFRMLSSGGGTVSGSLGDPRQVGVTLRASF